MVVLKYQKYLEHIWARTTFAKKLKKPLSALLLTIASNYGNMYRARSALETEGSELQLHKIQNLRLIDLRNYPVRYATNLIIDAGRQNASTKKQMASPMSNPQFYSSGGLIDPTFRSKVYF